MPVYHLRNASMPHYSPLFISPTQCELSAVEAGLPDKERNHILCYLCGFGPIAAAARTASLIIQHKPTVVLLAGIAGSLDARCQIGSSYEFSAVRSYRIGVGTGELFQSAEDLEWKQWQGDNKQATGSFGDVIQQTPPRPEPLQHSIEGELLSVCSASSSPEEAAVKKKQFPTAMAEDMEGFAVAAACTLLNVPWVVIRGISNTAGDRDKAHWHIEEALHNVSKHVSQVLTDIR